MDVTPNSIVILDVAITLVVIICKPIALIHNNGINIQKVNKLSAKYAFHPYQSALNICHALVFIYVYINCSQFRKHLREPRPSQNLSDYTNKLSHYTKLMKWLCKLTCIDWLCKRMVSLIWKLIRRYIQSLFCVNSVFIIVVNIAISIVSTILIVISTTIIIIITIYAQRSYCHHHHTIMLIIMHHLKYPHHSILWKRHRFLFLLSFFRSFYLFFSTSFN